MSSLSQSPMRFQSINPADGSLLAEYSPQTHSEVEQALLQMQGAFEEWKRRPVAERAELIRRLGAVLQSSSAPLAQLATREMGKPILQARAEVEKCAGLCRHYAEHGPSALEPQQVQGNAADRSVIRFDPLGAVLAVMPWNFPYWQVLRFAVPTLLAGNVALLKHASNVLGCAAEIQTMFHSAGFPEGIFTSLRVDRTTLPSLIGHASIRAVTLTGSEAAGMAVAQAAGNHLKKCVLELGGSDPFIVLPDADLPRTISQAVQARIMNNGQSCIAAKRFIVHRDCYSSFLDGLTQAFRKLRVGDPLEEGTELGPLAREDLRETLHQQVQASLKQGARLLTGGRPLDRPGWYYEPTVLADVGPEMTAFQEETFGPVAAVTSVDHADEAVELANQSSFGLGASIWTRDIAAAERMAGQIESGSVFINDFTRSDATLPFGGVKRSGYGRELSHFGLQEFVNIKTVWINEQSQSPFDSSP